VSVWVVAGEAQYAVASQPLLERGINELTRVVSRAQSVGGQKYCFLPKRNEATSVMTALIRQKEASNENVTVVGKTM